MVNISGFNASEVEPSEEFELLPEGKYHAEIVESEERDIGRDGEKGTKISLRWKILSGQLQGRLVFQDILHNYNVPGEKGDKTRDIASRQLSAICHATGRMTPQSTEELHNIPCEISVGFGKQNIDPNTGQPYPRRNEVKGVKAWGQGIGAAGQSAPQRQSSQQQPQRAAASGGWARKAS